ncbi:MAG: putative O-glycosylation ligase, exosortase A system-associated [Rhizobacter sp.]|nr:putative O-glycosylation ligase, exosortase A system-associated [Rhizobacter sp.]
MRDILFAIVLVCLLPLGALHPWIGASLWAWVSLMSPHRMTYSFMYDAPVAMLTGLVTILGLVFSRDPKRLPNATPLVWLAIFAVWMVITYFFSLGPAVDNFAQLDKVMKIYLMTFIATAVMWKRSQIDVLVAICAFSIAFFGVKGGVFTIVTGGGFRVRGEGGFIAGNNEIALALVMIVPLMYYFVLITERKLLRYVLWASMGLCVVAVLGTQSRGGLLGILGMAIAFIARSDRRFRMILPLVVAVVLVILFMPDSWWERMGTIGTYDEDASAMGRINAWSLALNIATHRFFGGGFTLEYPEIFSAYAPDPDFIAVAHSIYFQVLGQHGFVGLALYLGFWLATWRTCRWISKNSPSPADRTLSQMVEVSLAGFAVGGAFLNLAYFDGPYYLMAAMVVLRYKILNNQTLIKGSKPVGQASSARGAQS